MLIRTNGLASVGTPAKTIDGVIERMNAIDAALPSVDGVAYFNRLYLKVTESVLETMQGTSFEDEAFLESLDVSFADRYFSAFADWERTGSCDQAWRPLFRGRSRPGSAPVQFALAGMNAHINHDLPLALIATCRERELEPLEETPHYRDYTAVNDVLAEVQERIKGWFAVGLIASVDDACGKVDDALAVWSIRAARRFAWEQAELLWALADNPRRRSAYEYALARMVGFTGEGILL